jgi:hypothetical protein
VPERNAQVQKIDDIYAKAVYVRVWLGVSVIDGDLMMNMLREIHLHLTVLQDLLVFDQTDLDELLLIKLH